MLADTDSDDDDYYDSYGSDFSTTYNGDSYAYGDYMSDSLTMEGMLTIPNLTMGLVNDTSSYTGGYSFMGVLAIGYNDSTSSNFPDLLVEQGLINTTAYSIWMDDEAATSGSLLFGAIDTSKFTGNLTRIQSAYSYIDMMVQVVSINATMTDASPITITGGTDDGSSSSTSSIDSSTDGDTPIFTATYSPPDTLSIVPSVIASQIWEIVGAYYQEDYGLALIGCSAASDTTVNITMQLGSQGANGPIITATMSDLVVPSSELNLTSQASSYYSDIDGDVCVFGVQNSSVLGYTDSYSYGSLAYSLGSTMLRRTYSVIDLANSEVAIAPVVFGASEASNIVPFTSYGATVPSSTVVCSYSDCSSDTGSSSNGGTDSENEDSSDGLHGVLPFGTFLGLILGLCVGFFVLGFVVFLIWRHRRRTRLAAEKEASVSSAEAGQPGPEMSTAVGNHTSAPVVDQAAPAQSSGNAAPEQSSAAAAPVGPSADPAPAKHVDKGKGPEIAPSLPPIRVEDEEARN